MQLSGMVLDVEKAVIVVKATAICVANTTNCVAFAEFQDTPCLVVELCNFVDGTASFTADCSDIIPEFLSCKLTCSNGTSEVTGVETCVDIPDVPAPTVPTPVAPSTAPPSNEGDGGKNPNSGSNLAATQLWRVASALSLVVLGHFAFHH